jgi:hypothetical protein
MFHPSIVKEIQDHGLPGPLAREVASFAQLRCIHEDGIDRPHTISYNGMVPGSPNKEVRTRLVMPDCTLGKASSNDGQGCYVIKGPRAHVFGSVAVGLWFDMIINSERFRICSNDERKVWAESRQLSHMLALDQGEQSHAERFEELKGHRDRILKRANAAYGPQGNAINQTKEKLRGLFEKVL